jgi:hypothetical protein
LTAATLHEWSIRVLPSIYHELLSISSTYDHRILRTRLPVRSALFKQDTGGLVVRWVTTSESPLLYVFVIFAVMYLTNECLIFANKLALRQPSRTILLDITYTTHLSIPSQVIPTASNGSSSSD